ncbi:MAG: hypothetical protein ACON4O_06880 [Lentimonas sp.]
MTEEKFSELVNLYLDKEISSEGIELLKAELGENPDRKNEFQERCRLHQAMRLAMGAPKGSSRKRSSYERSRSGSSSRRSRSGSGTKSSRRSSTAAKEPSRSKVPAGVSTRFANNGSPSKTRLVKQGEVAAPVTHFPRWISGLGLAACLALGGVLLYPVFTDTIHFSKQVLEGIDEAELERAEDPLNQVKRSDLVRFASQQQKTNRRSSSLAAELRLLGLHPELMDEKAELTDVSLASIQPRDVSERRIEMFNQLRDYSPLPEPQLFEVVEPRSRTSTWPSGFQSSQASFK